MPTGNSAVPTWVFKVYRPFWLVLNLTLIVVTFTIWANANTDAIKVDLANIKAQTAKLVKNDDTGTTLATNFGFKTREADGMDFCAWASSADVKSKLKAPFNTLDCGDKDSITLKNFQAYDLHTYADAANTTVWHVYAYGENGVDGQLFADGANLKVPVDSILDPYLKKDGIYSGPHKCTTTYLKYFYDLTLALGVIIIFYLTAHIAHWIGSANDSSDFTMMILDYIVLGFSVVTYTVAIVAFFVVQSSKLFTECAWISTSFQDDNMLLFLSHWFYVVTGFGGLVLCIVHVVAVRNGLTGEGFWYNNLVVGDNFLHAVESQP